VLNALLAVSVVIAARLQLLQLACIALGQVRQSATASLAEAAVRVPLLILLLRYNGIEGAPIASAISAVGIGVSYLSYGLARQLGMKAQTALRFHLSGVLPIAALLTIGAGIAEFLPLARTWVQFAIEGASVAGVVILCAIVASPVLRGRIRERFADAG
jgi:hypothetical protein